MSSSTSVAAMCPGQQLREEMTLAAINFSWRHVSPNLYHQQGQSSQPETKGFWVGQRVIIQGLETAAGRRHNGRLGVVLEPTKESTQAQRLAIWLLGLAGPKFGLLVRPKHIFRLGPVRARKKLLRTRIVTELHLERLFRDKLQGESVADIVQQIAGHIETPHEIFMFSGFRGKVFDEVISLSREPLYLPRAGPASLSEG